MGTLSRFTLFVMALSLFAVTSFTGTHAADAKAHRVAIHVDQNDAAVMNLALNNAVNVIQHYSAASEEVEIEIVAYGPGLHMLREDTSPVKARIKSISESMPGVAFTACGNTSDAMKKAEGKEIPLVSQAKVVPAGVVRLMELQEKGWSYVKP